MYILTYQVSNIHITQKVVSVYTELKVRGEEGAPRE